MKLRLIVADDQPELRAGLRPLLEATGRVTIVGEAGDGAELLELLQRTRCDAILLDLAMPRMNGLDVLRTMARGPQHPPVIVLSIHDDAAHVDRALALGASGYLLKSSTPETVIEAVEAVVAGGAFIHPSVAQPLLRRHLVVADVAPGNAKVSPRQHELLRALAIGLSNKAIADRLGLTEQTVKGYLKELYGRIGVTGRAAAVAWAMREGLIE